MKTSLQLSLGRQLTITPQLQQAIQLLQLSTVDLQQVIQQQLEVNPMLEIVQNNDYEELQRECSSAVEEDSFDFQWLHLYTSETKSTFNENNYIYETLHCTTTNLQDHLRWQMDLTPMSDIDRVIATAVIDAIDDDGFLTLSLLDLHESLNSQSYPLDKQEIEAVIHRIQHFDPIGCAANSLADTLQIQLDHLACSTPYLELAKELVADNIELLGQHNYRQLMKIYHIDETALNNVLQLIQSLNPRPGSLISSLVAEYITPDLTVKKINNAWHVELNKNTLPCLSINSHYASLIKRSSNSVDNQFLKTNLQEARWFMKSIQSRQETLLKVSRFIVDYQQDFLELGEEAMKPLILNDVASALDMHESTISRVTTQKYIHTPRGLFELKYFFSSHVSTEAGGECSSTAIQALIKKLIAAENCKKPLSDSKLATLMGEQGIQIARRTVAKYRETMKIPPSNERKAIRS